jgi:branched-chain amino acid transport system substrate-binding protein/urea transport system substrate-binding protein
MIDALEGLSIESPTGTMTIGKNHHVTMNLFLARTEKDSLVTVRALGEVAPEPGCK